MKLSLSEQMKKMDQEAVNTGIYDIILMENASIKSFYEIKNCFGDVADKNCIVFAGFGNNGGDSLALARHLYNNRANVFVYMLGYKDRLQGNLGVNFNIISSMNIPYKFVYTDEDYNNDLIKNCDLIIDGIFGTGLSRNAEGKFKDAIDKINSSEAFVVSLDLPSGIAANSGKIMGAAVKSDLTPTFALAKPGHFLYPGREYAGNVKVVDISTPRYIIDNFESDFYAITKNDIILKKRDVTSHKGIFGHLSVIGGSLGKSGAVIMASLGACKTGAGLVSACIPKSINTVFESNILEAMSYPLEDKDGFISKESAGDLLDFILDKTAVSFGMGLGVTEDTKYITDQVVSVDKPLIIDADGLNCLSGSIDLLKSRKKPTIITPHPKEFARLINRTTKDVIENRLELIRNFAQEYNTIVVLKMADTIIADTNGKIYINTSGNQGMAAGGSGDVLSGMIGSFLAQGYRAIDACRYGVFLHGLSADLAYNKGVSYESMMPNDIIDNINEAIKSVIN